MKNKWRLSVNVVEWWIVHGQERSRQTRMTQLCSFQNIREPKGEGRAPLNNNDVLRCYNGLKTYNGPEEETAVRGSIQILRFSGCPVVDVLAARYFICVNRNL